MHVYKNIPSKCPPGAGRGLGTNGGTKNAHRNMMFFKFWLAYVFSPAM